MEHGEGPIRGTRKCTPRLERHIDSLYPDAEEGGVLPCEEAENAPGLDEISRGIVGLWHCCDLRPKEIEGPGAKGHNKPFLGAEEAVDGPGSRSYLVCHTAHG
jgi:hypothetical protein